MAATACPRCPLEFAYFAEFEASPRRLRSTYNRELRDMYSKYPRGALARVSMVWHVGFRRDTLGQRSFLGLLLQCIKNH